MKMRACSGNTVGGDRFGVYSDNTEGGDGHVQAVLWMGQGCVQATLRVGHWAYSGNAVGRAGAHSSIVEGGQGRI